MSCSFDPDELALLQRVVDKAGADLKVLDERGKSLIAARVVAAAERGERKFERLLAHAKGDIISHAA